ncbi:hypothetical protein [Fulvivirga lutimaris]|uniref:hypothetical protein n=1 Tax=Fulvivirga lutimaris TaxID=1819566 RepID=UPI0012BB6E32|nr:hypothetical protein [Fulvivirga lutimaris]MTI38662.1 hypothetical protein [Fulvivirga lutimaris]
MRKLVYSLLLLIFCASLSFAQDDTTQYDQESAIAELGRIQSLIQTKQLDSLEPALLEYLYNNRAQFPKVSDDATLEERAGLILPVYTQITQFIKWSIPNSTVAITSDQAKLMAILGYQSVNLLQVANQFIETLSKDDPSYEVRMGGYNQAVGGVQTFLKGYVVSTFIENQNQEMDLLLVDNIKEFGPALIEKIPEEKRSETIASIKDDYSEKVSDRLKKDFKKLLKLLGKEE